MKKGTYTLEGSSVNPSVTLPCHMSIFHSVTPQRHGVSTNTYAPMVRPVNSLFKQIKNAGGNSAMYYGWEPLRDVSLPGYLKHAEYIWAYSEDHTDRLLTESALTYIKKQKPDFVFLYMVETDEKGGHDNGWMSQPYLQCIHDAIDNVKKVLEEAGEEYTVIVTADHGGHDRVHGTELPEDMTIPMFFVGPDFEPGKKLSGISLLDIAPTIADIMGILVPREWEGKSIVEKAE
jgi:arylsulfatase A-like enzyme